MNLLLLRKVLRSPRLRSGTVGVADMVVSHLGGRVRRTAESLMGLLPRLATPRRPLFLAIGPLILLSSACASSPSESPDYSKGSKFDSMNLNDARSFKRKVYQSIPIGASSVFIHSILPSRYIHLSFKENRPEGFVEVYREYGTGRLKNIVLLGYDTRQITIIYRNDLVIKREAL